MKIRVDSWAWLPKDELTLTQLQALRAALTVIPKKVGDFPGPTPGPIKLYIENDTHIGVAREYFAKHKKPHHEPDYHLSEGRKDLWFGDFTFTGSLRAEQELAVSFTTNEFQNGRMGGMIRAAPGWGKTVAACALIDRLHVPTLVIVHKQFLVDQWVERLKQFLPEAQLGTVQQDICEYEGKSVVIGMVHSLVDHPYPKDFYEWPGLLIVDEAHRIGAETWSGVPPKFAARWRVGFSATPRRKDGAENVFLYNIGPVIFKGQEKRLAVKVRKVVTNFRLVKTESFNPKLIKKTLLLQFLCASNGRNKMIVDQLVLAVQTGRKVLVLSERLQHLEVLQQLFISAWPSTGGPCPSTGQYVGGMSKESLAESAKAQAIFATSQFVQEGLDIPALDTLFLTTPLSDVEQAVGRIQRPCEGKKDPIVVDFQDPGVPLCIKLAEYRDQLYAKVS